MTGKTLKGLQGLGTKPKREARSLLSKKGQQCAAIPIRIEEDGRLSVMLVTSRETQRWVIPKGWIPPKLTPAEAAAREAFEEAGLVGQIVGDVPFGTYRYEKRVAPDHVVTCKVIVFLLSVHNQLDSWPEMKQRKTRWCRPAKAASLVNEGKLAQLILSIGRSNVFRLLAETKQIAA